MNQTDKLRSGGQLLVDCLREQGAEHIFCVPGESYLPVLDALYDTPQIRLTSCRQEGGAAMMAEAHGKLTGRPGICLVTRGPGATNASAGLHIAFQDSTPMLLLIGQVGRDMLEREAFQEIDYRRMFGQLAKWVAQIDDVARIPEFIARAYRTAMSGRPGPVVLALPEDMLRESSANPPLPYVSAAQAHPGAAELAELRARLQQAKKPLAIVGGGDWSAQAKADLQQLAERWQLPVATSFRCQDYFDNQHSCYAGDVGIGVNPALAQRVREADLLLVIGARLGEMTSGGYTLLDPAQPQPALVHVYPAAEELGRVYQPSLAICSGSAGFVAALAAQPPEKPADRTDWLEAAHDDYLRWSEPQPSGEAMDLGLIVRELREKLPENAILCNGAGNYAIWLHRFYRYRGWRTELAPTSGSMGYGVPAAIAAKQLHPQREVICWAGDGCFLMHGQELATAVQQQLAVIFIVANNSQYATIRMHQARRYRGRPVGTALQNPEFAALARAYGAHGERIEKTEDFAAAFERARAANGPALIELICDPGRLTPTLRIEDLEPVEQGGQVTVTGEVTA